MAREKYPAAKVLCLIADDLKLSNKEMAVFLRLGNDEKNLRARPSALRLGKDASDRTKVAFEIHALAAGDSARKHEWFAAAHTLIEGESPKRVLLRGSLERLTEFRDTLQFSL